MSAPTWTNIEVSNLKGTDNILWTVSVSRNNDGSVVWKLLRIAGLEDNGFTPNHPAVKRLYVDHTAGSLDLAVSQVKEAIATILSI